MTDYKQLCAELLNGYEILLGDLKFDNRLAKRARAALAEPEPQRHCIYNPVQIAECGGPCEQGPEHCDCGELCVIEPAPELKGPTDEELNELFREVERSWSGEPEIDFARAVLTRWGNHPGSPDSSTPQPVPVSERLPLPEDCNDEGEVWAWRRFDPEGDMDNGDLWCLAFCDWLGDEDSGFTHWLPAHALPLPS